MGQNRTKITFDCPLCRRPIEIDISAFHQNMSVPVSYFCENSHKISVTLLGGKIISINPRDESDIVQYPNVPDHLKEIIREAYICKAEKAAKAGMCMVRLMLDGLLWELGFHDKYVGDKVKSFEQKCNSDANFKQQHATICAKVDIFRTISQLAGYHVHAQSSFHQVQQSDFETFMYIVEGAIKDRWPK